MEQEVLELIIFRQAQQVAVLDFGKVFHGGPSNANHLWVSRPRRAVAILYSDKIKVNYVKFIIKSANKYACQRQRKTSHKSFVNIKKYILAAVINGMLFVMISSSPAQRWQFDVALLLGVDRIHVHVCRVGYI